MALLEWLESTAASAWVRESLWGYPIVLCSHAVGMAAVVGVVLMMSMRVLGYAPRVPFSAFGRLFVIAWIGLALNAASGVLLFAADAVRFIGHWAFLLKMALIVAGGISVRVLLATTTRETEALAGRDVVTGRARTVAALSIVFWVGAIVAGRLIAYT